MSFERTELEGLLPDYGPGGEVAHYTRIGTLPHLFRDAGQEWNSARATGVLHMNDRQEFLIGCEALRAAAKELKASSYLRAAIDGLMQQPAAAGDDIYSLSFSGNPDELGQWRGYADGGFGCAVVTDVAAVYAVADVAAWTIYTPHEHKVFAERIIGRLATEKDRDVIRKTIQVAASFMKHEGFAAEREYRLLVFEAMRQVDFRESGQRVVPFVDVLDGAPRRQLPIKRIIIGPGWQISSLAGGQQANHHVLLGVRRLLAARSACQTVKPSSIPYDPR